MKRPTLKEKYEKAITCSDCHKIIEEGTKVKVIEASHQRLAKLNGQYCLIKIDKTKTEQMILCKECEQQ